MFQLSEIEQEFLCDFVPRVIIIRAIEADDYHRWIYEIWRQDYDHKTKNKSQFKTLCRKGVGIYSTYEAAIEAGQNDEIALKSYFDRLNELRQAYKNKEISRYAYKKMRQEAESRYPATLQAYAASHGR